MDLPETVNRFMTHNISMANLSYRPNFATLLIFLGVGFFATGVYGTSSIVGTRAGCLSLQSVFDMRIIEVTPRTLTYENRCNSFSGPTYAALWPVGFIIVLLGAGSKIDQVRDGSALWTGIATVLLGVAMLAVGGVFGLLPVVFSVVLGLLGLAWLKTSYRSPT